MEQCSKKTHITKTKRENGQHFNYLEYHFHLTTLSSWMSSGGRGGGEQMDHLSYLHNPPQNLLIHTYQEKQHQNQQKPLPWFFSGLNGLTPVLHFLIPSSPIFALLSSPAQVTKQYLPVFHNHIFGIHWSYNLLNKI